MSQNKKVNILVILIFLGAIIGIAYMYNSYISDLVTKAANRDRAILQTYNNEIIGKLICEESTDTWPDIVEQYDELAIFIVDGNNDVVAKSVGASWSALDAKGKYNSRAVDICNAH